MPAPTVGVKVPDLRVRVCTTPDTAGQTGTFAAHPQVGAKRRLNPVTGGEGSDVGKPDAIPGPEPPAHAANPSLP